MTTADNNHPAERQDRPFSLSHGARSAIALVCVCGVAALAGVWTASEGKRAEQSLFTAAAATPDPRPHPSETFFSAEAVTDPRMLSYASGTLKSRDTLIDLVARLGADRGDAHAALKALYDAEFIDPRKVRPGLSLNAVFEETNDAAHLVALTLKPNPDRSLIVERNRHGRYEATALDAKLVPAHGRIATTIETSIYDAVRNNGATDQQVVDFASVFAYDVDFQREIHPGDTFEIVYESWVDERGTPVRTGEVLFAELNGKALRRSFYRHTPSDDEVIDYYDSNGESATKFLMKTPINGARLSSNFGRRRHPISGYSRLHKGTDFAARTGTPVYAAGHGTIERSSRYGGYGNYVRIRHANGYKTAYAHLSRYGPGVKSGRRVRQGDVIGYVGSTGASTGPHLHYEVIRNGTHVNAMKLDLPTGRKLTGDMLEEFMGTKQTIDLMRANLGAAIEYASASPVLVNQSE